MPTTTKERADIYLTKGGSEYEAKIIIMLLTLELEIVEKGAEIQRHNIQHLSELLATRKLEE